MPKVRVLPSDVSFEIAAGKRLLAGGLGAGLVWPNVCGGVPQCGVCVTEIIASENELPEPTAVEAAILKRVRIKPIKGGVMRLACQLVVNADLQVYRIGVRKRDDQSAHPGGQA